MTKDFQPQHTVSENPYGTIAYGPMSTEDNDDGTRYVQTIAGDHITWANKNGNKTTITPGTSGEICGTELVKGKNTKTTDESVAKAIIARKGDIVITAEHGNIKLKAKNIWIETTDEAPGGNFNVNANGHIDLTAGEKVTIGGTKLCLIGKANLTLFSNNTINLIAHEIKESNPFSIIAAVQGGGPVMIISKIFTKECGGG